MSGTALLTAVGVLISRFTLIIPLFGYPSLRFSLTHLPIFLVASLFGPILGGCSGFIMDIMNFILQGGRQGAYHPGFTLNSILAGVVPGTIFSYLKKHPYTPCLKILNAVLSGIMIIGASVYIYITTPDETVRLSMFSFIKKRPYLVLVSIVVIILLISVVYICQKMLQKEESLFSLDKVLFAMLLKYIVIQLVLTPLWMWQLYQIPPTLTVLTRIFKAVIDIPLQVGLVLIIFAALPRQVKGLGVQK
jgi:ECF transporter S component (folate family)